MCCQMFVVVDRCLLFDVRFFLCVLFVVRFVFDVYGLLNVV